MYGFPNGGDGSRGFRDGDGNEVQVDRAEEKRRKLEEKEAHELSEARNSCRHRHTRKRRYVSSKLVEIYCLDCDRVIR